MKASRLIGMVFGTALAVALISCGTDSGSNGPSAATPEFSRGSGKLLKCTPQAHVLVGQMIGPSGGEIRVGKHRLEIPSHALTRNVYITMEMGLDSTNSVQFQPEGLVFARPAKLTLDYGNCSGIGSLLPLRVAYTTNLLQIIQYLISIDNKSGHKVSAQLQHFSRYAVAY